MGLRERLLKFIDYRGMDKALFERNVGLSNGFVDKSGDNTRSSSLDKISITYPELNVSWLRTGEGEMLKGNSTNTELQQKSTVIIDKEAWNVIKMQARSLERKDDQMAELIQILKSDREKMPIKVVEDAGCADAKASSGE